MTALSGDLDGTDSIVGYSLVDDAGGRFQIDPVTGIVSVLDLPVGLRDERVSHGDGTESSDGSASDTVFTINLVDDTTEYVVSTPTDSTRARTRSPETASVGDLVGVSAWPDRPGRYGHRQL